MNNKEKDKSEENDEDNLGKDNYFMLERKSDSYSSDSDEDSDKTIPNVNNYLNKTVELNDIEENPRINQENSIINDNINKKQNGFQEYSKYKKNINDKKIFNNKTPNGIIINPETKNKEKTIIANENSNIKDMINEEEMPIDNQNKNEIVEEIIESISSSSSDDDVNVIEGEQFIEHFRKKDESERKIKVIDPNEMPLNNNLKEILKKHNRKKFQEEDKIFDAFFMEKNVKKNIEKPKNQNEINFNFNKKKNKFNNKTREFVPMFKGDFKNNTYFEKLLINRVEHQILTDIYNTYEDKQQFNQTNYYINEIKKKIIHESVEEAMKYLDTIEPMELRTKIAIESTYFFKEVVREEIENAKVHNGELILIKQPDFFYNQQSKFSGTINHGNIFRRKGKSIMRNHQHNYRMNNLERKRFNDRYSNNSGEFENSNNKIDNISNSPFEYQGQILPKKKYQNYDSNDE